MKAPAGGLKKSAAIFLNLIDQKRQHHQHRQHRGQVLFAVAVVMLEFIVLRLVIKSALKKRERELLIPYRPEFPNSREN